MRSTGAMKKLTLVAFLFLFATPLYAQSYHEIEQNHPSARAMYLVEKAPVYRNPNTSSREVRVFDKGEKFLVYKEEAGFYAVAKPGRGHLGYVKKELLSDSPPDLQ